MTQPGPEDLAHRAGQAHEAFEKAGVALQAAYGIADKGAGIDGIRDKIQRLRNWSSRLEAGDRRSDAAEHQTVQELADELRDAHQHTGRQLATFDNAVSDAIAQLNQADAGYEYVQQSAEVDQQQLAYLRGNITGYVDDLRQMKNSMEVVQKNLAEARRQYQPVVEGAQLGSGRTIDEIRSNVARLSQPTDMTLGNAHGAFRKPRENLDTAVSTSPTLSKESNDLAQTFRQGLNPTPEDQYVEPADHGQAASHGDGPDRDRGQEL